MCVDDLLSGLTLELEQHERHVFMKTFRENRGFQNDLHSPPYQI